MKHLFFDTETSGLNSDARIIQLAWQLYEDGTLQREACDLIFPVGWEIPAEPFWIENGFSTEKNRLKGVPIEIALHGFLKEARESDLLVAHNMDFDFRILNYEIKKLGIFVDYLPPRICTMKTTTDFCKLPGQYGNYKWPRLEELHEKLFGVKFENAHDALSDVRACAKCFFELQWKGLVKF